MAANETNSDLCGAACCQPGAAGSGQTGRRRPARPPAAHFCICSLTFSSALHSPDETLRTPREQQNSFLLLSAPGSGDDWSTNLSVKCALLYHTCVYVTYQAVTLAKDPPGNSWPINSFLYIEEDLNTVNCLVNSDSTCRLSSLRLCSSVWCLWCWSCRSWSACCTSARRASICSTRMCLSLVSTSSSLWRPSVWHRRKQTQGNHRINLQLRRFSVASENPALH